MRAADETSGTEPGTALHLRDEPYLEPIAKPRNLILKLGYVFTRRRFGRVPGPLSVFCARMPTAFARFYMKPGMLDKRLKLAPQTSVLVREHVASTNVCRFCMDASRWAALNNLGVAAAKLDALADFRTSPLFNDSERAALAFASELTEDRRVSPETFAELSRHYSDREICDIVFLVGSEHLYNITNIGLNIGSAGMCEARPAS